LLDSLLQESDREGKIEVKTGILRRKVFLKLK